MIHSRSEGYFGSEVKAEAIRSHERSLLVRFPQDTAESKVQSMGTSVVLHD